MKKALSLLMLSAFLLVGAGCQSTENDSVADDVVSDDQAAGDIVLDDAVEDVAEVYTWDEYGISFDVPEGENVLSTGKLLLISAELDEVPETDATIFETIVYVFNRSDIPETFAADVMQYDSVEVVLGDYTFNKSVEYEMFGDITVTYYILEFDDYVMVYRVGQGDEAQAEEVLSSLKIE